MKQVTIIGLVVLATLAVTSANSVVDILGPKEESTPQCLGEGSGCSLHQDCCSKLCMIRLVYGIPQSLCTPTDCLPLMWPCFKDSHCCSGHCEKDSVAGVCL